MQYKSFKLIYFRKNLKVAKSTLVLKNKLEEKFYKFLQNVNDIC